MAPNARKIILQRLEILQSEAGFVTEDQPNDNSAHPVIEGFEEFKIENAQAIYPDSGVILIHGFSGTPLELSSLAFKLTDIAGVVSVPRLPGHCTHSDDLLNYTQTDWIDRISDEIDTLIDSNINSIVLIGHSMGGNIALMLAEKYRDHISGVVTLSLPYQYAKYLQGVAKVLSMFGMQRGRMNVEGQFRDKSILNTKYFGNLMENYKEIPYYALHEAISLINQSKNFLPHIECPVILLHSDHDLRAHWSESVAVYNDLTCEKEFILIENGGGHLMTVDLKFLEIEEMILDRIHKMMNQELMC